MVAFMHTGTRLTAGYRYTTLGDATIAWAYARHALATEPSSAYKTPNISRIEWESL